MSDLDISGAFNLDSSGGISELDNIVSTLSEIDAAASSAGNAISSSMDQARNSFADLGVTVEGVYAAIEAGAASAIGATTELGGAAKEAGEGAKSAPQKRQCCAPSTRAYYRGTPLSGRSQPA